ncbi:acetyltransferase [Prochlorococcus marinus XMU1419]|uniref:acetyltransferase n=1 Tax=Prochlorococcus marinus TaxID=1219 RepID=UPI001ADBD1E4|nr:acetyltransferase [Prochlorococcus marinus]MBO8234235.1 acetyltransferase [Prochlorococcus marinus XMU1419]
MKNKLLILGSGGHGRVVADVAEKSNKFDEISFLDNNFLNFDFPKSINSKKVIGDISKKNIEKYSSDFTHAFVGIGDNKIRIKWLKILMKADFEIPKIIDPSAQISKYALLEKGSFINTNVVIQCNTKIEFGSILNTSCTIDHDSIIGEGTHISPGANIAGNVNIGKFCWIGIGSQIIQNVKIGDNVTVGGGSLVLRDIPKNLKVFGSPINVIKENK